jgi:hypothetical protein
MSGEPGGPSECSADSLTPRCGDVILRRGVIDDEIAAQALEAIDVPAGRRRTACEHCDAAYGAVLRPRRAGRARAHVIRSLCCGPSRLRSAYTIGSLPPLPFDPDQNRSVRSSSVGASALPRRIPVVRASADQNPVAGAPCLTWGAKPEGYFAFGCGLGGTAFPGRRC